MNIYEKLVTARLEYQNGKHKMSGKNAFAGYEYYELSDILPVINQLAEKLKFVCEVSFGEKEATLFFRDTEKPEDYIIFSSPMSTAVLKGCHEVQNLGAVETYIKRYLYQNAFEIVETDSLNKTHGQNDPVKKPTVDIEPLKKQLEPYFTTPEQKAWLQKETNPAKLQEAINRATKKSVESTLEMATRIFEGEK